MVRKPRSRKAGSRSPRQRATSSRTPQKSGSRKADQSKAGSRAEGGRTGSNAELEALRAEIRSSIDRISAIERRLEETDQATKNAISRFSQIVGELNVRLTSIAANVFEVIAMAKTSDAVDRPPQTFQLRSKLDGDINR